MKLPYRTAAAILTFIGLLWLPRVLPALKAFATFDPQTIAKVIELPVPKPKPDSTTDLGPNLKPIIVHPPTFLSDPKHELDHFYDALTRGGTVRILHYGDSPTTGDLITADARAMLQKQFGDAGSGFILISKPWAWYTRRNVDMSASSNWKIDIAGIATLKDGMHGVAGVTFIGSTGASANWKLATRHSIVEAAYLAQPDGGSFEIFADDKSLGVVDTAGDRAPGYTQFEVPDGATHFALKVTKGTVRLYGVEFRKHASGIIYSSLGINGANITVLSHAFNYPHWTAELHHYKPDLVIVNYGTNESGFEKFVTTTWGPELKEAVRRLRTALPNSSVLLMSPMDRGDKNQSGEIVTTPALPKLVQIESQVAAETGVAFFNTFQAMGGEGTMAKWYAAEPRLVSADFIHPTWYGAKIVGELLYNGLHDGYNGYKLRQLEDRVGATETASSDHPSDHVQSDGPGDREKSDRLVDREKKSDPLGDRNRKSAAPKQESHEAKH